MKIGRRGLFGLAVAATAAPAVVLADPVVPSTHVPSAWGFSPAMSALPDMRRLQTLHLSLMERVMYPPHVLREDGSIESLVDHDAEARLRELVASYARMAEKE